MAEEKRKPGRPAGSKNKTSNSKSTSSGAKKSSSQGQSRAAKVDKEAVAKSTVGSRVRDEIWAIVIIAIGLFLIVAIQISAAGAVGEILHDFFLGLFGWLAHLLPYYLIGYGVLLLLNKTAHISGRNFVFLFIIFLMLTLLNSVRFIDVESMEWSASAMTAIYKGGIALENGGWFGMVAGTLIAMAMGKAGLVILALVVICVLILLVLNTPVSKFVERMRVRSAVLKAEREAARAEAEIIVQEEIKKATAEAEAKRSERKIAPPLSHDLAEAAAKKDTNDISDVDPTYVPGRMSKNQINIMNYLKDDDLFDDGTDPAYENGVKYGLDENEAPAEGFGLEPEKTGLNADEAEEETKAHINTEHISHTPVYETEKKLSNKEAQNAMLSQEELNLKAEPPKKPYKFPSIELLNKTKGDPKLTLDGNLKMKAAKLEQTLQNFNVDAKVVQVTQGPAVTRYEIQPAVGVKVSKIVSLADDIALNMEAKSIRIEAPIPGKAAVGIEIENEKINMVTLREIVGSKEFKEAKSKISFSVGRDIAGRSIVGDLKGMPHMLIAGSTGSGKSVCINTIILSILYKAKPEEVKFVLVDPKVVELGNYNGIPHLLIPVVTEPSKAAAALNWAVAEMTERYKKFAEEGVRDLESFNNTVKKNNEPDKVMPQIVIIIDELADLMMAAPSQVEESICRLAQMARAAGMHLIVATQRPSVDVVTGVIKANIPSRIAFAVSSQVDSRTILDMGGAEKLVGKGDMLYNPLGMGKPLRVQGAFVSDEEVHRVIEFIKEQSTAEYADEVLDTIENSNAGGTAAGGTDDGDELLADAIELVVHSGQASVSMLQRRFRIGYNRAARIIDMMEARGIVGPPDGSRPRQVLMTEVDLYALKGETEDIKEEL